MKKVLCLVLLLSGCALFDNNKTPLTPQGQMNVCIRDEIRAYKEQGKPVGLNNWSAAQKIAQLCTDKYQLHELYNQAVTNARNMMNEGSRGTSLK